MAGEPVNDFDSLHYEREADLAAVKEGYDAPMLFDAAFKRKLHLYQLLFAFPTLAVHHQRGHTARVTETQERIRRLRNVIESGAGD